MTKPTIPEVLPRFVAYYKKLGNGTWGSVHIVIEDSNVDDGSVQWCVDYAEGHGDQDGKALAELLLTMSKTQRLKIFDAASKELQELSTTRVFTRDTFQRRGGTSDLESSR